MAMRPVSFVKQHPVATIVLLGVGYMVVPWTLGFIGSKTGVNVTLPQPGSS
jgi:hypothetical protein